MNIETRAHLRRKRRLVVAASVIAPTLAGLTACAPQPATPAKPSQLTEHDVLKLRGLDPSPRPRKTPHAKPRHTPARIGWALTMKRSDPTPEQLARLRWCESGRDGSYAVNSSSGARGFYQFLIGTWRSVGGHGDPAAASLSEQTYRAVLLYRREGWRPWLASASCTGLR